MSPQSDNEIGTLNINTLVIITNIIGIVKCLIQNQNTAAQQLTKLNELQLLHVKHNYKSYLIF